MHTHTSTVPRFDNDDDETSLSGADFPFICIERRWCGFCVFVKGTRRAHSRPTMTIYIRIILSIAPGPSVGPKRCAFLCTISLSFFLTIFGIYIYYICCVRCTDWERAVFIRYSLIGYIYMLCWCVCIELTCAADSLYAFGYEAAWRIGFRIVWFAMGRRQRANRFRLETIYKYTNICIVTILVQLNPAC